MALARLHNWVAAEVLYAADLEAEFNNIINNATDLISPLTGSVDVNGNDLTAIDEIGLNNAGANASAAGRVRRNSANVTFHDGTAARRVALLDTSNNFGLNTYSFGTDAASVVAIPNGTAPTTSPTDLVQFYAGDQAAGKSGLIIRTEDGSVHHLGSNIGFGQVTWGTNADNVLAIASGTAPTTSPADAAQVWVADIAAGQAGVHMRDEGGSVYKFSNGAVYLTEVSAPSTPASSTVAIYPKAGGGLYYKDDVGVETAVGLPRAYLAGLGTAQAADTAHDVTISAGTCRSSDNTADITLTASITKRLDAAWAVGDTNGGIDTGAIGNNTWYYIFLIKRSDTGVVDALFSTSATSPTMPTNYDLKRRIWAVQTKGAADIRDYTQRGDYCVWSTSVRDLLSDTTEATTARTLTVPTAFSVRANISVNADWSAADQLLVVMDGDANSGTPDPVDVPGVTLSNAGTTAPVAAKFSVQTSAAGQIITTATGTLAGSGLNIYTYGYTDRRGRDD